MKGPRNMKTNDVYRRKMHNIRNAAIRELIKKHQKEYRKIMDVLREKAGIPRVRD